MIRYEFRSWDIYCDGDDQKDGDDTTVTVEEPDVLVRILRHKIV